jgi:hypothetical protein
LGIQLNETDKEVHRNEQEIEDNETGEAEFIEGDSDPEDENHGISP